MSQKEKTVKIIDDYFEIDWLNYIAKLFKHEYIWAPSNNVAPSTPGYPKSHGGQYFLGSQLYKRQNLNSIKYGANGPEFSEQFIDPFNCFVKQHEESTLNFLDQIQLNCYFKDLPSEGSYHADNFGDPELKIMILLLSENGIYEKKWGGSFYYKDEENKEVEVPFKHGRLICFKGGVIHKAHPFNITNVPRYSIRWSYRSY
tara:strand:- start:4038 stop:4640 length:603 start_codon:yes stop_codon:yes gene_type:complete